MALVPVRTALDLRNRSFPDLMKCSPPGSLAFRSVDRARVGAGQRF